MSCRFLAIDFETANYKSDSACAVGLVLVEGGKIRETQHFLIRPPYRNFVFTEVHGITWKHVDRAPHFLDLWPQIAPLFQGIDFLVAHNAGFDRKVLMSCCERYEIPTPSAEFRCTVQMARKFLGIYPTNLPAVCQVLDIPLKHHDAASDALACAKIAMTVLEKHTLDDLNRLMNKTVTRRGNGRVSKEEVIKAGSLKKDHSLPTLLPDTKRRSGARGISRRV